MSILAGKPSDDAPAIVATGQADVTTLFVSMSARHPEGRDAAYLAWHSLDHRPEQHRLAALRASFRLVSTPACRSARAVRHDRYDATDHLMTYLFKDPEGLAGFSELSTALAQAGRVPYLLPVVERSVYRLNGKLAATRIKAGADVLPWWPAKGVYVLIERGSESPAALIDIPGIGGIWWGNSLPMGPRYATAQSEGLQISYCFLDEGPADTAARLTALLDKRWARGNVEPLFAAPFHTLIPYEWDRFVP